MIVGLLLAILLGGLWGFNRSASTRSPISSPTTSRRRRRSAPRWSWPETVPRYAPGIGSIAAVHQVTVNPEVAGRVPGSSSSRGSKVKAGDPLVQLNDAPDRADLANYQAQAKLAEITLRRVQSSWSNGVHPAGDRRLNQSQLDQANARSPKPRRSSRKS